MKYKSYQRVFHLKRTCRRERGTETKHERAGKTLAKKGKLLFILGTEQVCLNTKRHLQACNRHHFTHYPTACEHRKRSISLCPQGILYTQGTSITKGIRKWKLTRRKLIDDALRCIFVSASRS